MPKTKVTAIKLIEEEKTIEIKKHSSLIQINNVTSLLQRKIMNAMVWLVKTSLKQAGDQTLFRIDL